MGKDSIYYKEKFEKNLRTKERLLVVLPPCCREMVDFKDENGTAISTQISYCYDLAVFFRYYIKRDDTAVNKMKDIDYNVLDSIPKNVFCEYRRYLEYNEIGEKHKETNKGIARKFASLKNLYKYHMATGNIKNNPLEMIFIQRENRKDHSIVRLTKDEVEKLLKANQRLTIFKRGRMRTYKKKTQKRDCAMLVLLLNTGLRISELVGLDLSDVNLHECSCNIYRKGGFSDTVYFNPDIRDIIKTYIKTERREIIENKNVDEKNRLALFLSIQGQRWSAESIENTVRQYTTRLFPTKHITPHKLRATYGSLLYSQTGDIKLVADVLGHENINTTIKYYAATDTRRKRQAALALSLCLNDRRNKRSKTEKQSLLKCSTEKQQPINDIKITIKSIDDQRKITNERLHIDEMKKNQNNNIIEFKKNRCKK